MRTITILLASLIALNLVTAACDPSLVAYFKFDGNLNNQLSNSVSISGFSSGLSYVSTPTAKVSQAAQFIATTGQINDPPTRSMDFGYSAKGFTIELWLNDTSPTTVGPNSLIDGVGYTITLDPSTTTMTFTIKLASGASKQVSTTYTLNTLNYYAFIYNPAPNTISILKNGELTSTANLTLYPSDVLSTTPSTIKLLTTSQTVLLDELAIYNVSLTPQKTKDHYTLSNLGKTYCDQAASGYSSFNSQFNIAGCTGTDATGKTFSLDKGTCSRDGDYYCSDNEELQDTRNVAFACSMGATTYNPGSPMCCPSGLVCSDSQDGVNFFCELLDEDCSSFTVSGENDCLANGCYWLEDESACVTSPKEYGCSIYNSPESCDQDTYNVGSTGFGTGICDSSTGFLSLSNGAPFLVPTSTCSCFWDFVDSTCKLTWTFTEALKGSITSGQYDEYSCATSFLFGFCVGGQQEISWETQAYHILGPTFDSTKTATYDATLLNEAKTLAGCDGTVTTLTRTCGEPVLNFPVYSNTALIMTILLLTGIYYRQIIKKKKS